MRSILLENVFKKANNYRDPSNYLLHGWNEEKTVHFIEVEMLATGRRLDKQVEVYLQLRYLP